jgi:hypothetical protein
LAIAMGTPENEKHSSELFQCGHNFIKFLLTTQNSENIEITNFVAGRQWEKIDIWAEINNEYLIIIEDKTCIGEHSNQLEKYKRTATDWCQKNNYKLICIYFHLTKIKSTIKSLLMFRLMGIF